MKNNILYKIWSRMTRIRAIETEISKRYSEGKMRCPTHLSIGQECVPSVISEFLSKKDFAVSGHRGHAHYLAKGGNLKSMIAELYGKETGCSKGRGGSMHLIDQSCGFMGTTAIVANSIPLGVGYALSSKQKNNKNISCIYLGDGAVEEGVFYESINFASVKELPALFVCENNFYSVYSPLDVRQPINRSINKMIKAIGIESSLGNGNDPFEVYKLVKNAKNYIRNKHKPYFLEFYTYRYLEHCGPNYDDDLNYRPKKELKKWKLLDPIKLTEKKLYKTKYKDLKQLNLKKSKINLEIKEAFNYAEKSKFPSIKNLDKAIYAR